ncbi:MAG TPA: cupin domain-containing protein [Blastocatellia bacterium]|nr:cupin domain-containing protein [Blastocatellia bacterium]
MSLTWLLDPLSVDTFLDDIWAKTHYLVKRRCPDYFAHLFGVAAVEDFLEYVRPEPPAVRLVRRNENLASVRLADGSIDMVRVRNAFADGYTIVLNGLERYMPEIAAVARTIEVELNFETQVNAYITPPQSQGFLPHYDDHDVLILQSLGSKTWHLYGPDADVPTHELRIRTPFVGDKLSPPCVLSLEAGDLLYIPRGRVHAAEANAVPSIHLTVGIHPPTVLALVTKALEALSYTDDRVLARLPPKYLDDAEARRSLDALVRDVLSAVGEPSIVALGLGAVEDALVRLGRCRPVGQLVSNAVETHLIDGHARMMKSPLLRSRVLAIDGGVALQFAQSLLKADSDHRAAMLFLSRTSNPFRVDELPELPPPQQIELARKLVIDGFLVRLPND